MVNSHFIRVEAERYRSLAARTVDPEAAQRWWRVVAEYETLAQRYDDHVGRQGLSAAMSGATRSAASPDASLLEPVIITTGGA